MADKSKSKTQPLADLQTAGARVRELAWIGQHAQAIDLATEALSRSDWQSDRPT